MLIINAVMTVLVMGTFLVCINIVPKFRSDRLLFLINSVNIALNMFGMNWLFQALEKYDYITIRSIVFKIISVALMFVFVHDTSDYVMYGAITVFAAVGSNLLNLYKSRSYVEYRWIGKYNFKQHMKPIFILFAENLAASIYTNLDTVMLGFMKTDADVGYYNAAIKVKTILVSMVTSLGNVLLPRMSYYAKEKKNIEFRKTAQKALNCTMMIAIPLAIYFSIFSAEAIHFLAGDGYDGAIIPMRVITISIIPIGLTGILGIQILTALEKEKYVLYSVITGAIVDFALNLMLIPRFGATGAAYGTVIAESCVLLVQLYYTKELLIEVKKDFRLNVYLISTWVSVLTAFGIRALHIQKDILTLLLSAIVFFGTYMLCVLMYRDPLAMDVIKNICRKFQNSNVE